LFHAVAGSIRVGGVTLISLAAASALTRGSKAATGTPVRRVAGARVRRSATYQERTVPALVAAMHEAGRELHEEAVLDDLLADLG
jgi:hypothetical protein